MRSGTFVFPAIKRVAFGQPAAQALRAEVERLKAKRVFLMVSGTMNRTTGEVAKVCEALGQRCAGLYDQIPPHTPRSAVLDATRAARAADADLIVTFGGGSVTDAGKMVRIALQHGISDIDSFEGYRSVVQPDGSSVVPDFAAPTVQQIAIPTTLSGGEFGAAAACNDDRTLMKQNYRHRLLVPRVIILDPGPTVHTPLWVWLSTGIRALDHAAEGICSQFSNPVSDASFLHALQLLSLGLPRIKLHPDDMEARLDCLLAVWLSKTARQAGVQMGASHAIGHVLGGTCEVPHGYTSCIMLPHVLRYNCPVNGERQRLVAQAMGRPGEDAADVVAKFIGDLGLPTRLAEVGVKRDQFAVIAANAMHGFFLYTNPRKITSPQQVLEILDAAA